MIILDNEPVVVSKFISAHKLWEDKFVLEIFYNNKNKNRKQKITTIELTIGDIACFVKPHSVLFVIPLSEGYFQNVIMVLNLQQYLY